MMFSTPLGHQVPPPDEEELFSYRSSFTRGFTEYHELLLNICLGFVRPPPVQRRLNKILDKNDLGLLKGMVQIEFLSGLEKNRSGTEEASGKEEPHPYDVFLMETTLSRQDMGVAVCMPTKSGKTLWYNGRTEIWSLDSPPFPKWRIASLSGPARILAALSENPDVHPLMEAAMKRELLMDAEEDLSSLDESRIWHLNESQKVAVATVTSPSFQSGFFCIQGPPGYVLD